MSFNPQDFQTEEDKNISGKVQNDLQNDLQNDQAGSEDQTEDLAGEHLDYQAEYNELQNKHLRLHADFDNFKRAMATQAEEDNRRTKKSVILTVILPLLDNLKLALDFAPKSEDEQLKKYVASVESIVNMAIENVKKLKAEIIRPALGDDFDQTSMEAIQSLPNTGQPSQKVVQTVSFGLRIDGVLVVPARVIVAE